MEISAIKMEIGGICAQITSLHDEIIDHVTDRYRDFLSDSPPDFCFEMAFAKSTDPAEFLGVPGEMLGTFVNRHLTAWEETNAKPAGSSPPNTFRMKQPLHIMNDRLASRPQVTQIGSKSLFQRRDLAGWIDVGGRLGRCVLKRYMEDIAIESFIRICYSFLAVQNNGLLLHSAGIVRKGNGYIFPGVSGTGKSTIARLATSRERVLSDELVMVRKNEGDFLVYSTPFFGTNKNAECNSRAILKAAFLPVKDSRVCLEKARPAPALSKLMSCTLFFSREDGMNRRLMDISAEMVDTVPFYDMHFRRDRSFWECISAIERNGGNKC